MAWFKAKQTGSPFAKSSKHKEDLKDARGRIEALDALHREIRDEITELTAEAGRIHGSGDALSADIKWLLGKL